MSNHDEPDLDAMTHRVEQLYRDHNTAVLGYLARRMPAEDAADVMAEVLEVVWRRRTELPSPGEEKLWMFGIARHLMANLRRNQRRRIVNNERLARCLYDARQQAPTQAEMDLQIALEGLQPLDREILTLNYWEGFTLADVGSLLGMRIATVRSRHQRARRKLLVLLELDAKGEQPSFSA